jgi:predicted dehydrogenase
MSMRIGLIGCGNISDIYLLNGPLFRDVKFVACADINEAAAKRQAERYAIRAMSPRDLIASADIDIVLNLTIPESHAEVSQSALEAGKHVYGEKPLATNLADGVRLMQTAAAKGLRFGCAPDTVLGASIQEARRLIDSSAIGKPVLGVASVMGHGMEHWHPNPGFFFRPGGGPVFDMGPYYLTALVTLLGPVASVAALGQIAFKERVVSTPGSAMLGQSIKVETLTSAQALLEFESGAQITFLASWDVWSHGVLPIELFGETGSMRVPDPNWFGGDIAMSSGRGDWSAIHTTQQRFGEANWPADKPVHANYRGLGLADMARGIEDKRPHRVNGDVALHVLAIMAGILEAATERRHVTIAHRCERPAGLGEAEARDLLA